MKFKEYVELINKLAEENPESLEFDVIYAVDDEGNGYCRGVMGPSLIAAEDGYHCDIYGDESEEQSNAVLIN